MLAWSTLYKKSTIYTKKDTTNQTKKTSQIKKQNKAKNIPKTSVSLYNFVSFTSEVAQPSE